MPRERLTITVDELNALIAERDALRGYCHIVGMLPETQRQWRV